jgi:transposase
MPSPISSELRKLIIKVKSNGYSVTEITKLFSVKKTEIYNLFKRNNETGSYELLPNAGGRRPALSMEQLASIAYKINEQPDVTLQELIDEFILPVCISALCKIVYNLLGFRFKQNSARRRTKS